MPLTDPFGRLLDGRAVGDVADLVLGADLGGRLPEPLLTAAEEDAEPAPFGEAPCQRRADPSRAAGNDGHAGCS